MSADFGQPPASFEPAPPANPPTARPPFGGEAAEILERMDEGFYAIDGEWRLVYVNRSAERFWGRNREDLLGRSMLEAFSRFPGSEPYEAHRRAMADGQPLRIETRSTVNGTPVELSLFPDQYGLPAYFRDPSLRHQLEGSLRERNEILTLAELSAGIGVWDSDLATDSFRGTPQFFRLLGLEPTSEPVSLDVSRGVRHPDDRDRVVGGFKDAIAGGSDTYEAEYRIIRPDGETRWIFGRGRVIRDATGMPVRYSGIDIDITDRKHREDQLRVVMRELLHRTNNLLAVIQAMVHQTARTSTGLNDFERRFGARIRGLAHSNELLVRQDWRGGLVDDLVRAQLAPFMDAGSARLSLAGPPVMLKPQAVQNIGLALHELATNASKYGSLSMPEGRIIIDWHLPGPDVEPRLFMLRWRELAGPPVKPPKRKGFGRFVVESMIKQALDAEVSIDFSRSGLVWTVEIPVDHLLLEKPAKGPV